MHRSIDPHPFCRPLSVCVSPGIERFQRKPVHSVSSTLVMVCWTEADGHRRNLYGVHKRSETRGRGSKDSGGCTAPCDNAPDLYLQAKSLVNSLRVAET